MLDHAFDPTVPDGPSAAAEAPRWYVVQTHPHKEALALAHLERQGFPVFLPRILRSHRSRRGLRDVLEPLFPRYAFVALALDRQPWRKVRSTVGVRALIMEGDRPRPVPRGLVEEMRALSDQGGRISLAPRLEPGSAVRFVRGPFADCVGRLLAMKGTERAVVLMTLLGAEHAVTVDARMLQPSG